MIEWAGPIECELLPRLIQVTEAAAIAAAYQMGRGNKNFAEPGGSSPPCEEC